MILTITADGRDKGKCFKLREADAFTADKWCNRAMLMLISGGADVPKEILNMGVIGLMMLAQQGLRWVRWSDLEPLLDELFETCVQYVPTPARPEIVRPVMRQADDVEEVSTLREIRMAVFKLHAGFIEPAAP